MPFSVPERNHGHREHAGAAPRVDAAVPEARACTAGDHVVARGAAADKQTLARELTHVIRQRTGPVAGTGHGSGIRGLENS